MLFDLGQVVATPGVLQTVGSFEIRLALERHVAGDWGDICEEDAMENEFALENGYQLLSSYTSSAGVPFWIITESDRSCTTVLLPYEY